MSIGSSEEIPEDSRTKLRLPDRTADAGPAGDRIAIAEPAVAQDTVFEARAVSVNYGEKRAIEGVTMDIDSRQATAFIGPSGCGKSTFLRCLNRMNDSIAGARVEGQILLDGQDIHDASRDVVQLRN